MYELKDIDSIVSYFYDVVREGIEVFIPRAVRKDSNYPCWFSRSLISKIKVKRTAHRKNKRAGYAHDYKKFSNLRKKCKSLCLKCYQDFIGGAEERMKKDPAYF